MPLPCPPGLAARAGLQPHPERRIYQWKGTFWMSEHNPVRKLTTVPMGLAILVWLSSWPAGLSGGFAGGATRAEWTHPKSRQLVTDRDGPFVLLEDGRLMTVEGNEAHYSSDDGRTWSSKGPVLRERDPGIQREWRVLQKTRGGALVLVFMDTGRRKWGWNNQTNEPDPGVFNEVWSVRSLDQGETWIDAQLLSRDYCGALVDILETRSGRVVVPVMKLMRGPARHSFTTFFSDDAGRSWSQSNLIDLGGHGHHDGAIEPTLVELRDGRLWTLIRTNWDRRPGARRGLPYSRIPGSWQREELSIAFSEDDGKTWTRPQVVARQPEGWLSYPYLFERRPGEIWLTTHYAGVRTGGKREIIAGVRLRLMESEFVAE